MIIRYRPKFIDDTTFKDLNSECITNDYYFNSGRAALKALFTHLQQNSQKELTVAMQSFNCHVVAEAVLQAGLNIELFDIKKSDFSLDFKKFKDSKVDILILTHYQGIINEEYFDIVNYCQKNKILLIEDCAITVHSSIEDVEVGSLGDITLRSYSFDKPFVALFGGSLQFNNFNYLDKKEWESYFKSFPIESEEIAHNHIKTVEFLMKSTIPKLYKKYMTRFALVVQAVKAVPSLNLSEIEKFVLSLKNVIDEHISIQRLHPLKISFIQKQQFKKFELVDWIENYTKSNYSNMNIFWNRFSLLDTDKTITKRLLSEYDNNIEIGNYNWPKTLDELYCNHSKIKIRNSLKNSAYVSKNIINIPVWQYCKENDEK